MVIDAADIEFSHHHALLESKIMVRAYPARVPGKTTYLALGPIYTKTPCLLSSADDSTDP
jgi:hypothetical protein